MVRNTVAKFDPATADTTLSGDDLVDATQGASGLVMLIELHKAVELVPRATKGDTVSVRRVNRVAFVPSRPGRVMEVATDRGVR